MSACQWMKWPMLHYTLLGWTYWWTYPHQYAVGSPSSLCVWQTAVHKNMDALIQVFGDALDEY